MQITAEHIIDLFEERYRERGMSLLRRGMVELLDESEHAVSAKCLGTQLYTVSLELKNGTLVGTCSCPAFEQFGPCKHMAAVAHAVRTPDYAPSAFYESEKEGIERIEQYLSSESKEQLVARLMALIMDDPELQCDLEEEMEWE